MPIAATSIIESFPKIGLVEVPESSTQLSAVAFLLQLEEPLPEKKNVCVDLTPEVSTIWPGPTVDVDVALVVVKALLELVD